MAGFLARLTGGLLRDRTLQAGAGITITNPAGDAGDPVISATASTLAAGVLLGRGAASGTGAPEPITLGSNISMTGTVVNVSGGGGGGTVTNTGTLVTDELLLGNGGVDAKSIGSAGTAHQVLHGAAPPTFSAVDLAADVTGTLPIANGGTNSPTALSGSSIMVSDGSKVIQGAAGTTSTVLHGNAAGAPAYGAVALATEVSGTLADARLSANVPLLNAANAFTGANSFATSAVNLLVGQIAFPAAQNPSANANTLDDYEEGSWTPIDSSGASLTFSGASGSYVKIGLLVFLRGQFTYPVTANGTANVMGGLPFTAENAGQNWGAWIFYSDLGVMTFPVIIANTTTMQQYQISNQVQYVNSAFSGKTFFFQGYYRATS